MSVRTDDHHNGQRREKAVYIMRQRFIYRGMDVTTDGNELSHAILRGGMDKYGETYIKYC